MKCRHLPPGSSNYHASELSKAFRATFVESNFNSSWVPRTCPIGAYLAPKTGPYKETRNQVKRYFFIYLIHFATFSELLKLRSFPMRPSQQKISDILQAHRISNPSSVMARYAISPRAKPTRSVGLGKYWSYASVSISKYHCMSYTIGPKREVRFPLFSLALEKVRKMQSSRSFSTAAWTDKVDDWLGTAKKWTSY